jgi:hypothetical protein
MVKDRLDSVNRANKVASPAELRVRSIDDMLAHERQQTATAYAFQ